MKVNPYHTIPTLVVSLLAIAITGCSSSGSSYTPDHAADKAYLEAQEAKAQKLKEEKQKEEQIAKDQAEKRRLEAEKEAANQVEKNRLESEQKAKEQALAWRSFEVISSADGGYKYSPVMLEGKEGAYYSSGPIVLSKAGKAVKLDDASLQYDKDFFKKGTVDPNSVQYLEIKDTDGTLLGKFQFVNQEYASYATFVSAKPANQYGEGDDKIEPLVFYTAKLSTADQLAQQKGTFDYNGKVIGYKDGVKGSTPTESAVADVHFEVNFDNKTIKGEVTNRFDGLTKETLGLTKGWDDNDDPIYYPEHNDLTKPLILKETAIKVENGVVGFGHQDAGNNAGIKVNNDTEYKGVTDYGGVFAGPNLENVVGHIGGGEERVMFGATKGEKK